MSANFTPNLGQYTRLTPFRYWCQKVLPLVYDDSLSYYELLNKVVEYLNETMEDVDTMITDVEALHGAYDQLQQYVNDYFDNLDVQTEINNKLDQMADDGSLDVLLLPYFNEYKTEINAAIAAQNATITEQNADIAVLSARMDTFASLPDGSTAGDAELLDIRVGANGATYPSAGDAVREQVSILTDYDELINAVPANMINPAQFELNKTIDGNGVVSTANNFCLSPFIDISNYRPGIQMWHCNFFGWYDENKAFIPPIQAISSLTVEKAVTIPANAKYIRIVCENARVETESQAGFITEVPYTPYGVYTCPNLQRDIDALKIEHINRLDKSRYCNGYLGGDGIISVNTSYITSGFIAVTPGEKVTLSNTNFVGLYDINKAFVSLNTAEGNTLTTDKVLTIPQDIYYLRITYQTINADTVQVGPGIKRNNYIPYDQIVITNASFKQNVITVGPVGCDYTSLSEAVYINRDVKAEIIVEPGTYDIVSEYNTLFGSDVINALSDSTDLNMFQYGIYVHDKKIVFKAGTKIVMDWTGRTVDGTHRISAFAIGPNTEIIGLDLDCTNTFYCIHDDYGTADNTPFTVKYENCRIIGHNIYNANCIGGGVHKYSTHMLHNCYLNNNASSSNPVLSADARYHNTNTADAEPLLFVSDCYFAHNFNVTYYGQQTTKFKAYVNNCYAPGGINKLRESSTMNVDNVELYTWNNQQ